MMGLLKTHSEAEAEPSEACGQRRRRTEPCDALHSRIELGRTCTSHHHAGW